MLVGFLGTFKNYIRRLLMVDVEFVVEIGVESEICERVCR